MAKDEIVPGKKISIQLVWEDPIWDKGFYVTFVSLNEIEYEPRDRWLLAKVIGDGNSQKYRTT